MFRRILLCYDGTVEGRRALRQGADVAIAMKAETYLLAICRALPDSWVPEGFTPHLMTERQSRARALLDEGIDWLRTHGLAADGALVEGDAIGQIARTAKDIGADLIVVGHRPRGRLDRWWSDSEEQTLLEHVSCSVLAAASPE
jgi:nucleotide-binding universal stress UspA family protein